MALGVPDSPPEGLDFVESLDDETCPVCGWDREEAMTDPQAAHNSGVLLAVERGDSSPYSAMAGAVLLGYYWRCPNKTWTDPRTNEVKTAPEGVTEMHYCLAPRGNPSNVPVTDQPFPEGSASVAPCSTYFTTEEEVTGMGGMS